LFLSIYRRGDGKKTVILYYWHFTQREKAIITNSMIVIIEGKWPEYQGNIKVKNGKLKRKTAYSLDDTKKK
jgi:hypothetical protein